MTYQEAEQVGLKRRRSKQAIALAMEGQWREAIAINKEIIEDFPNDVEAYNRLGKAYMEVGEYSEARDAYKRAVELDPYNAVAVKNLRRLSHLGELVGGASGNSDKVAPEHFIEEVGKAGVVNLYRLGSPETLARMVTGDRVYLKIDSPNLVVGNARGEYLGQLEPKHAQRLIRLMEGGNEYSAAIVSSAEDKMTVIIREVYQHPSQAGRLSFPARETEGLRTYVSDRILRRELEHEEELVEEPGFTIIGGDEPEVFFEEPPEAEETDEE
jgi:tetratricopeptide (TPR) repeat protein